MKWTYLFWFLLPALIFPGIGALKSKWTEKNGSPKKRLLRFFGNRSHSAAPASMGKRLGLRLALAGAAVLLAVILLPILTSGSKGVRVMNGLSFQLPEGFSQRYSDSRYAVWEYTGGDKRPGKLILDAEIRDGKAQSLNTAEEVLVECAWLTEAELYVNPQGVRMVRGFTEYSGMRERRYYIESPGSVMLMCMIEDSRFYDPEDCEEALLRTAESVRPAR